MLRRIGVGISALALMLSLFSTVTGHASQLARSTVQCKNQTYGATVIDANIVVPAGAYCNLNGTHVTGNASVSAGQASNPAGLLLDLGAAIDGSVRVQRNGQFAAFGASTVGGNVTCNRCQVADVSGSTVKGALVDYGVSQGAFIENSHFGAYLVIVSSTDSGFGFNIVGNSVGKDLVFYKNIGTSNISNNTITEDLTCKGNTPPPAGTGNTAEQKSGQCAGL